MAFTIKSKTLRAIFASAAILTGTMGPVPSLTPNAEAAVPVHVHTNAAAHAAAAAAARRRHDREATNAVITNPSSQNIAYLQQRGLVDSTTTPYITAAVVEMKIPIGTKPEDITEQQRENFMQLLRDKRLVAEVSSPTEEQAVEKGLSRQLAPYFAACKDDLGYSSSVTLPQAQAVETCMDNRHWENDTKPLLKKVGLGAAGLAVAGGIAAAIAKKRREQSF